MTPPPPVDLVFPVLGTALATDHRYPLFGALSRRLPWIHEPASGFALAPITGDYVGRGQLRLVPGSHLRLRFSAAHLPPAVRLAGQPLDIAGARVRLGVPHVEALQPVPDVAAHLVTIKHATEPDGFLRAARQKLNDLGIAGDLEVPAIPGGPRQGQPMRLVFRVKRAVLIGFPLRVRGLKPEESLRLQEAGLGGKKHMGGGFFLPSSKQETNHV